MNRRRFVKQSMLGMMPLLFPSSFLSLLKSNENKYFIHGIASGDPTENAIIIWTHINTYSIGDCKIEWQVSTDKNFAREVKKDFVTTSQAKDFTVKVDVSGLKKNQTYYYRFIYDNVISDVGVCKTLPDSAVKPLQIAVISCNNYEDGYFTSFRHIADNPDIDYVFHLGDYIYEYGTGEYCNKVFLEQSNRKNDPLHELVSLGDYRKRYALYRKDKELQKAHQHKPFICIWDDHELANNAYKDGAKNHQSDEGKWTERSAAAMQAYFEWMPVRAKSAEEMIRSIKIGNDANFIFLEERLDGRDKQLLSNDLGKQSPDRKMISYKQFKYLSDELKNSNARWNFLVNQVMFTGYKSKKEESVKEEDWWTGYPYQRNRLIEVFQGLKNPPIILTGDHHQSHVLELYAKDEFSKENFAGWEFLTPSITSKNDDRLSEEKIIKKSEMLYKLNPHMVYNNIAAHGYFILNVAQKEIKIDYKFNKDILLPNSGERNGPQFKIDNLNNLTKNV
ncbi:alkaline phosphatase D family protein [Flavobacterium sp. GN10]|uniref:Alkaline phosphatase D family protein n=1 Tax=Flavobacterium tagetis TaxID=2801336 RepID=A0ABS1KG18_9FLAO|nr:alkaline phosphatase D family protein [Flavobacterium tagetis]MBL0738137.1 alkaline phosphatase D family protein [Flavobacterium tagetis]